MARSDYDTMFYRVFCVTLLALAFTFTIILTNVFIDIDGLLTKKHGEQYTLTSASDDENEKLNPEPIKTDDNNCGDNEDSYRTKRSVETQNILFHIKDPKIKKILTSHLTSLLGAIEDEMPPHKTVNTVTQKTTDKPPTSTTKKVPTNTEDKVKEDNLKKQKDDDILHLTMHNILLQGIIGHMNMSEVQKRMALLLSNLNAMGKEQAIKNYEEPTPIELPPEDDEPKQQLLEDKLVAEIFKCNRSQAPIQDNAYRNDARKTLLDVQSSALNPRIMIKAPEKAVRSMPLPQRVVKPDVKINKSGSNVLIKTVIDIKSLDDKKNETISKDKIHGIIELIYNGQTVKFTRPDVEIKQVKKKPILNIIQPKYMRSNKNTPETTTETNILSREFKKIPKDYLVRFVTEYFKHFPHNSRESDDSSKEKVSSKRLKRFVKVKNEAESNSHNHSQKANKSTGEDDLYVEIETYIDSKGLNGEKKKQIIKNLINKIQKAIRPDEPSTSNSNLKKKSHRLLVKKRMQNPLLVHKERSSSKHSAPVSNVVHRQLDPISFHRNLHQEYKRDRSDDYNTNHEYVNPFQPDRTEVSRETGAYDTNINNVMEFDKIPQRIQKPLNSEVVEDTLNPFFDYGNMKFFIKENDGSGFSIGFNQYVDEPPDPEAMKLFSGVDGILRSYHQNYDQIQEQNGNINLPNIDDRQESGQVGNDHYIVRRSVNKKRRHQSNDNKVNHKILGEKEKANKKDKYQSSNEELDDTIRAGENIFNKNLNPAEIFYLADILRREKRTVKIKARKKYKLNKYLNTKMYDHRNRNKRETNKIRIIASDSPHKHGSEESVFIITDDNLVFGDRALVKEIENSALETEKQDDSKYIPFHTEETDSHSYKIYDSKGHHSPLMSKYPHVFLEEVSKSKEEYAHENGLLFSKVPSFGKMAAQAMNLIKLNDKHELDTAVDQTEKPSDKIQKLLDKVNFFDNPKTKYRVTVKIMPKNITTVDNTDFKEVHTSINKSYHQNGLHYSSLFNVTELTQVSKINKTKEHKEPEHVKVTIDPCLARKLKEQQDKIKKLFRLHKKIINQHMNQLKEEKSQVESILNNEDHPTTPHCDFLEAHRERHLHKEEELNKPVTIIHHTRETTTEVTTTSTVTTTQEITTVSPTPSLFNEKLKKNLMHTIERHENITDQIMKKIDKNTKILQTFLNKITDKIENQKQVKQQLNKTEEPVKNTTKLDPIKEFPIDLTMSFPQLSLNLDFFNNNDTEVSIPFVYALQQPIEAKNNTPMASLVYQGHIHASRVKDDKASTEKVVKVPIDDIHVTRHSRSSKDIEKLYKIIPLDGKKQEQAKVF